MNLILFTHIHSENERERGQQVKTKQREITLLGKGTRREKEVPKKWNVFLFNKKNTKITNKCVNQLCLFLPFYMQTKVNKSTLLPNYSCILKTNASNSNKVPH